MPEYSVEYLYALLSNATGCINPDDHHPFPRISHTHIYIRIFITPFGLCIFVGDELASQPFLPNVTRTHFHKDLGISRFGYN